MTLETWLRARRPAPPPRLIDRMCSAAAESQQSSSENLVEGARVASLHLLQLILGEKNTTRSTALDLLAADALMTCSCEASCAMPDSLTHTADGSIEAVLEGFKGARTVAGGSA